MWLKRRSLFNFRDHDSSKYGKESEIDCQCPRQWTGLVTPRILQEVETFIAKFPMAEVLTCPEDKLSSVPQRSWRRFFSTTDLKSCSGQQDAVWCWKETKVLVQVHGEAAVLGWWSGLLEKWAGNEMPWSHWFEKWERPGADDGHVKRLKLERGQPSRLCSGSGWAKNAVCGIFNPCEGGPLKFQSWRTSGGCSVLLDGLRVHSLGHWQSLSDSLPYLLESWPTVC